MDKDWKFPFYARASLFFIGMVALIFILYLGQGIIVPLIFAIIIAIVLHPVVNFLVRIKINRVVAIAITLILSILVIAALGTFLISQASRFSESWPKLVAKFTEIFNEAISWASGYFDISPQKIIAWIAKTKSELFNSTGTAIGQTLINVGNGLVVIFLIPVYIFMILFYQPLLIEFFRRIFGVNNRTEVNSIITQIKTVIQKYLTGLVIEAVIIAALNTVALLILGIEYAILLGILGALLNVIPYLGGLVGVALPMMIALVTKDSAWYSLYVLAAYYFIQLVDNNYIVPKIVASKVKINALVSIIVVLAFGALWGIPGMFISIPLTAIAKLIFDHIQPLKPWGFLLGDTMPDLVIFKIKLKKK
jgi:predicted PurR-regulated permease PerM